MDLRAYEKVKTSDGSFTLYNAHFKQCYHSTQDGALAESIKKHVEPLFKHHETKKELCILDICFGLGLNTLATLWYNETENYYKKITIRSPEFDTKMLQNLKEFIYPEELETFRPVIEALVEKGVYKDELYDIELYKGDARLYIQNFTHFFDGVYQDAFSPDENPLLWTKEYFKALKQTMKEEALLTSYSTALRVRIALFENGFYLYILHHKHQRSSTLATLSESQVYEAVNIEHKMACNPTVRALSDLDAPLHTS